jgi:P2 family phage contractile tail tube protein
MPNVHGIRDFNLLVLSSDGTPTTTQGLVTKVDLPVIEREFDSDARSGFPGIVSYAQGFKEMECSLTLKGVSRTLEDALLASINGEVSLQLSAAAESDDGSILAYIVTMRGSVMQLPTGLSLTPQENAETTFSMRVNYYARTFGGSTFVYDPRNNVFSVNGTDYLLAKRTALGV